VREGAVNDDTAARCRRNGARPRRKRRAGARSPRRRPGESTRNPCTPPRDKGEPGR
jgi:hypothetical protein